MSVCDDDDDERRTSLAQKLDGSPLLTPLSLRTAEATTQMREYPAELTEIPSHAASREGFGRFLLRPFFHTNERERMRSRREGSSKVLLKKR